MIHPIIQRPLYYILQNGVPVPEKDLFKWADWFEGSHHVKPNPRIIRQDSMRRNRQNITISTVFLALDHNYSFAGEPILYETMVFGGPLDGEMDRYNTQEQALKGHEAFIKRVRSYPHRKKTEEESTQDQ